jgi:3-hydroxy-3-methylglutaryl CoA synthase/uncharacterized OB-fold protein
MNEGTEVSGIQGYATYVPYWRINRAAVSAVLGGRPAAGFRSVASYDEDTTSMAVEAARRLLPPTDLGALILATTRPAYAEKTNASAIHAALDLPSTVFATDYVGSVRTAFAALRSAASADEKTLVALADIRTGMPGSADEMQGGDAGAAFVIGPGSGICEFVAFGSSTLEILERWRSPGDATSQVWEERFAEDVYVRAAQEALDEALKRAQLATSDVDRLIVSGTHGRAVRAVRKALGVPQDRVCLDYTDEIGNAGVAQGGLLLSAVLDVAEPGELIALVTVADGGDVILLRTTTALLQGRQEQSVQAQIASTNSSLGYGDFLTWKGFLDREPPRRPDPDKPMAPPSLRDVRWKFGLVGSACERCGTRFAPAQRICLDCGAVDGMRDQRFAEVTGTVRTCTVDRLAYTPSPPLLVAVVDFDGGGRMPCELTDLEGPEAIGVGDRVAMTFRRRYNAGGVHNYFWKARPLVPSGRSIDGGA